MEVVEFLEHTNYRNFKFQMKSKVQENLRRLNEELVERRLKLRHILEYESLKYAEELAMVMKSRIEETARKRHESLGILRMEREIEIEKFIQLKELQREMQNCEETRHKQTKALLVDTKQSQLYQIKERELMRQRERQIDEMWVEVTRRYNEEMMKQHDLERKLVKTIAGINEESNIRYNECQKQRNNTSDKAERDEYAKDDANAAMIDKLYETRMKTRERNKKLQQQQLLMEQIEQNEQNRKNRETRERDEELELNRQILSEALNCHYKDTKEKIHEAVWQEHYINHMRQEARGKCNQAKEFDAMFLGTGCVLQQRNKVPYNKAAR